MNREYNLNYIDDNKMCFSYEGPFWALTDPLCNTSAYVSVAFNSGFGQTACVPTTALGEGSPFDLDQFNNLSFTKYKFGTAYNTDYIAFSSVPGSNNMVDIKYIQLSEMIYVLADNLIAVDAFNFEYEIYIPLNGNSTSIKMEFNEYNNYIYCLSKNDIYIVDPLLNILMSTISIPTLDAADIIINPLNGDIYVSFTNSPIVKVNSVLIKNWSVSGQYMSEAMERTATVTAISQTGPKVTYTASNHKFTVGQKVTIKSFV